MKKLYPLRNCIKNYDWGSTTMLSTYLGCANLRQEPQAELWMGVHPKGPSQALDGKKELPLEQLIRRDIVFMLGEKAAKTFGTLPFLFKALAAERALSIQAHPNKQQAHEGFLAENKKHIALTDTCRSYGDSGHKPEIVCALSNDFWALCGFRPVKQIMQQFQNMGAYFDKLLAQMANQAEETQQLKTFFHGIMGLHAPAMAHIIEYVVQQVEHQDEIWAQWVQKLYADFGPDVGVLAPLYLNVVHLIKGQAVFLPAGQLHAYLQGLAIELMANSDNVLRGGLTHKHIDVPELERIVTFQSQIPPILEAEGPDGGYATNVQEFALHRVVLGPNYLINGGNPAQIILCTQGRISLETIAGNPGEKQRVVLQRGESLFMPYHAGGYLAVGKGELFFAQIV